MHPRDSIESRQQTEKLLLGSSRDFSQTFVSVKYLFSRIESDINAITGQTVRALFNVIESRRHIRQKQSYFLYRDAADALIFISCRSRRERKQKIIRHLQKLMLEGEGRRKRALYESLGSLPIRINNPVPDSKGANPVLPIPFGRLTDAAGCLEPFNFRWHGRTLNLETASGDLLCVKFATSEDDAGQLRMESLWQRYFQKNSLALPKGFAPPVPVFHDNTCLFRLSGLPGALIRDRIDISRFPAIAFIADKNYYQYINEPGIQKPVKSRIFEDIFEKCAGYLGRLCTKGIVHTAVIPLFHNRVQRSRREDGGQYLWEHGGRLDQWLGSSRFPNIAVSGLRDFEHLESIEDPGRLTHFIGEHLLGLILVIGSYFRLQEPDTYGYDKNGVPLDVRHLFDPVLFQRLVYKTTAAYYFAFTGCKTPLIEKLVPKTLIEKLIHEMGIDNDMEETLRVEDQNNMSDDEFYDFLRQRGYPADMSGYPARGENDIVLTSGPHLGSFNRQISVPELISFLFDVSCLCISERYLSENGLKGVAI